MEPACLSSCQPSVGTRPLPVPFTNAQLPIRRSNELREPLELIEETLELFDLSLQEILHLLSLVKHGIRSLLVNNVLLADDLAIVG